MEDKNMINWFEIPSTDFERACEFYSVVLDVEIYKDKMGETDMGFLPMAEGRVSGAVVKGDGINPSMDGVQIYLNCDPDLAGPLSRVEKAGGSVLVPKTEINPEFGYFAVIKDTEGNKVGLHSNA